MRTRILALIRMARPNILPGGILAYALGAAIAYGELGALDWRRAAMGLVLTEAANLATHYADEYADVDTDALTRRTWFSGGSGVLPSGIVLPVWALRAALTCAGLAVALTGWWVLAGALTAHAAWIVGLGLAAGWCYAMPPLALERRGLGELDNALLGAFLMPLMGYTVQAGRPSLAALAACLPAFPIVMAGLLAVHWADRKADVAVGRRTLTGALGERARPIHRALVALTYLLAIALAGRVLPWPVAGAVLATLPLGAWAAWAFGRQTSPVPSSLAMAAVLAAEAVGWLLVRN